MSEGESKDSSGSECPVCYEKFRDLEGASRTLSCGHVFCHDCLVKYLLSTRVDGQVQRTIVCPVCRYVTFLSKKSSRWPSMLDRSSQTLAVPAGLPDALGRANPLAAAQQAWRPAAGTEQGGKMGGPLFLWGRQLRGAIPICQVTYLKPGGAPSWLKGGRRRPDSSRSEFPPRLL
ncbi:RING finger protein 222 [Ailuropoda melanoleuca]|uniref:RING finger protein 222 n=1 Tax=Ailuropoda melanoleuca TaxID=9646 RepID=UPI001494E7A0|nr:RING finger protein 222 [Ailuropoda melanoleuca]